MILMADIDDTFQNLSSPNPFMHRPPPLMGFVGSYPPVTPIGREGPFFVNTYFLQKDRMYEAGGKSVPVRSGKC